MSEVSKWANVYMKQHDGGRRPRPATWSAKRKKQAAIWGGIAVAVLGVGVGGVHGWRTHQESVVSAASQAKASELVSDPRQLFQAARSGEVRFDDARAVMERQMNERMNAYFALPAGAQRTKYLDQQIDEMEKRFAERDREREQRRAAGETRPDRAPGDRPAGEGGGPGRPGGGPGGAPPWGGGREGGGAGSAERRQTRMDTTPPEVRAKRAEFFAAVAARRAERGLPERNWGGRGGGPGGPR